MEYLDIADAEGMPTGETVEREKAHAEGIRHRTAHVWLVRKNGGDLEVLLQKRSDIKDSFPGCYDISSAGHIPAGFDFAQSAVRELKEELGIDAREDELIFCTDRVTEWDGTFHGRPFHDREYTRVFALWCDSDVNEFTLQEEEVSAVVWKDLSETLDEVKSDSVKYCIYPDELSAVLQTVAK